jgi:hypothetical protein
MRMGAISKGFTTVTVSRKILKLLHGLKRYPREPINEVIERLVKGEPIQ